MTDKIVEMRLYSPSDHTFTYERSDGTRYLYHHFKDHDPESWEEDVDGYQLELPLI